MTISYNWLSSYLPVQVEPERLSRILTSVGLEVEHMVPFEEVKGGLKGLVVGEVLEAVQHPNADKLKLTRVDMGNGQVLQIVCGAPNVAAGQKVIVAPAGATIYPTTGEPLTMKVAKIRGEESNGMICAEDEIGLGTSHAGILVLPSNTQTGMPAAEYFKPYEDIVYEIGLTPNRMDAMSHWGVARDVCAYLSHHDKKDLKPVLPAIPFKTDNSSLPIKVVIENRDACKRYSGICISGITVSESPKWLQERLKSVGLRPINNIVDITNFIQHETGQPLHAFDYDSISGHQIVVKNMATGTPFVTLDDKERKLDGEDLMICDAKQPLCIAGVFGGISSGVKPGTVNIFLESAWFDPVSIRKTSFRHGLRTDAATRFEKGIDISNTVTVLKRAAMMITETAGGKIASDIIDIYPDPRPKKEVTIKYHYLKKLSGKNYHPDAVKNILQSLGFGIAREGVDAISIEVPYHKPDVSLPADIVEELLRIDGLDNIPIPPTVSISPSIEKNGREERLREKTSQVLTGLGYSEILTNSITNASYFSETELQDSVRLLNNLSSELNMLRPSMVHTALEVVSYNLNRKNSSLRLFEFGKTYATSGTGKYEETEHLCLYVTGFLKEKNWNENAVPSDFYYLKGVITSLLTSMGITAYETVQEETRAELTNCFTVKWNGENLLTYGAVQNKLLDRFDIRQPVYYADGNWAALKKAAGTKIQFREIPKFPIVERDLAMVVPKGLPYSQLRDQIQRLRLSKLKEVKLFDVFESEKLGADKKSMAINITFQDDEKTLTDKEIDAWMNKIMITLEKELQAEIRK